MVTVLGAHQALESFHQTSEQTQLEVPISNALADTQVTSPLSINDAPQPDVAAALVVAGTSRSAAITPEASNAAARAISEQKAGNAESGDQQLTPIYAYSVLPRTLETPTARTGQPLVRPAIAAAAHLSEASGADLNGGISADPVDLDDSDDPLSLSDEIASDEQYVPQWQSYTIQKGDTFTDLAERSLGLGYSEVLALLDKAPDRKALTRLRVGNSLDYKVNEQGQLLALRVMKDSRKGYLFQRDQAGEAFAVSDIQRASQATQRLFAGTVEGSFGLSALSTGMSNAEVAELTEVLSKKINFRRQARQGDHFQVVVESDMVDGKAYDSRILAAHYEGDNSDLTVIRHNDHFYTPNGKGLDPAFNRYPFKGHYRISSPFNLRRHHPITGRISPHLGTDFAMPAGTTVRAPADGRVIRVGHHPLAGNYIVIQHPNGFKTRYLHLSKALVHKGEAVTMNEKIALSGNTGRSTGAHLHYEIRTSNGPVNAMRVKLPDGDNLSGKALASFKRQAEPLLAKLDNADNSRAVAHVDDKSGDENGS
ncbi:peptidoglycan DD-metalloendopeptidase family protein [Kushneria phosphatilytica]|uniref:Peptidoglycan DD-metalloendopeptidase family protein n=2 Tax=Kushneria phosphatilytica TaxID=657387 RepID=A0A5C0ZWZ5_9GAMM|nr:peptidoglycan DD-metalloendopeptidase family protein [Kushneria phosphatilytica]QEL10681.1 peptidoglycan DD-metalloendopeptidase family protein [Kushneria phosphatilytica]